MSKLSRWLRLKLRIPEEMQEMAYRQVDLTKEPRVVPYVLPPHVRMGRASYCIGPQPFEFTSPRSPVTIGAFCSIAREVLFLSDANHPMHLATTYPMELMYFKDGEHPYTASHGPVVVGNDVWIGRRAIIMSGVNIGDGAVIGAGSVVTKDVAPYCIHAGNPAKFIKRRFDESTSEALLRLAWWDWPDEKLAAEREAFKLPASEFVSRHHR